MSGGLWLSLFHLEFYMESGACGLSIMNMLGNLAFSLGTLGIWSCFLWFWSVSLEGNPQSLAWRLVFYELSWGSE